METRIEAIGNEVVFDGNILQIQYVGHRLDQATSGSPNEGIPLDLNALHVGLHPKAIHVEPDRLTASVGRNATDMVVADKAVRD